MFDDRNSGTVFGGEFAYELKGGVCVVDVVVAQLFALVLGRSCDACARRSVFVKSSLLMRVLAVAQRLCQSSGKSATAWGFFTD